MNNEELKRKINSMTDEERDTLFFRAEVSQALARIYDVLLAMLAVENGDKAAELLARHELGKLWFPSLVKVDKYGTGHTEDSR